MDETFDESAYFRGLGYERVLDASGNPRGWRSPDGTVFSDFMPWDPDVGCPDFSPLLTDVEVLNVVEGWVHFRAPASAWPSEGVY